MTGQLELGFAPATDPPPVRSEAPPGSADWRPSTEQRVVVDLETDLVVTAGAGSGKTSTLVALYARALQEPESLGFDPEVFGPERILCLTFTERAAREIKERIRSNIEDPDHLRRLEAAPISTFHAFCASILRHYPLESGVDPTFSVLTEDVAQDLAFRAALETLRVGARDGDEAARTAIQLHGVGRTAKVLVDTLNAARTAGWTGTVPIERFEARLERVRIELEGRLLDNVTETATEYLQAAHDAGVTTPKAKACLPIVEAALDAWRRAPSAETAIALHAACKETGRSWRFDRAKELREAVYEAMADLEGARLELEHATELGCWPALVTSVDGTFERLRRARAGLDYDDLVLRTRALLRDNDAIRNTIRARFSLVLIDEHQDTDPVQQEILELIVGSDALAGHGDESAPRWCVVGDAKQAIYGFRGARVEAYRDLSARADERRALKVFASNYRSRPELVTFFNDFFPQVLDSAENPSQVGYDSQVAHRQPAGGPVVDLLTPSTGSDGADDDPRSREARALAARLRALTIEGGPHAIDVEDPDSGLLRPARPGDIALLMRKMTEIEPYRRALQAVGLDHIVVGSGGFYGRQETYDCLNALRSVLSPEDPVALTSFLRSPMVGLTDEALFRVVRGWDRRSGVPLRDHVFATDRTPLDPDMGGALEDAERVLHELRRRADREAPATTLTWLIDRTGYGAIVDALPDRAQRLANLDRLVSHAERAPQDGITTLSEWAATLRARVERPPRERDAPVADAGDRALVMTIHQAKGLQFPIVAVGDIGSGIGGWPSEVEFDSEFGVVAKWWDPETCRPQSTLTSRLVKQSTREREEAEEARLFYVAATRARDHLVLSAGSGDGLWLKHARGFAGTPHPSVEILDFDRWVDRYGDAIGSQPDLPSPGDVYSVPMPSAPGVYTAREVSALLAIETGKHRSGTGPARTEMRKAKQLGVAGHDALERLPPKYFADPSAWLREHSELGDEDARVLAAFVRHRLAPRLEAARSFHREHPFRLHVGGDAVITGAIDCLVEESEGHWSVWDYKFGTANAGDTAHEKQVAIYALAAAIALDLDEVTGIVWYVVAGDLAEFRWTREELLSFEAGIGSALLRDR